MAVRWIAGGCDRDACWNVRLIHREDWQIDAGNDTGEGSKLEGKRMVLVAEPKQVVAPGEVLAEGDHMLGDNAYRIGTKIFSDCVGILEVDGNRVFVVP